MLYFFAYGCFRLSQSLAANNGYVYTTDIYNFIYISGLHMDSYGDLAFRSTSRTRGVPDLVMSDNHKTFFDHPK